MEAKVARILSKDELVLNVGLKDGIKSGQEFEIYELGEEIRDPESGKSLGRLEIVKGRVTVISLQPGLCIAQASRRSYEKTRVVDPWAALRTFSTQRETYEVTVKEKIEMEATDSDYVQKLVVRVGDKARLVE